MHGSMKDMQIILKAPWVTLRHVDWGGMTVEQGVVHQTVDPALSDLLFKGLPDDRCQCPHWGYVLRGQRHYKFADHEEVYTVGEVYYVPPGHGPVAVADCEFLELSPTDQMLETMEVLERNTRAMQSAERQG
jgi:hypothetical protein